LVTIYVMSATCKQSLVYCSLLSRWSQRDLSVQPIGTTRKQRTNKLGHCCLQERPFYTLARYTLPSIRVSVLKWVGGKCACTLVPGTQDIDERDGILSHSIFPSFPRFPGPSVFIRDMSWGFETILFFFQGEIVSPTPTSQPRGSGSSHLNGLAWEMLPEPTLSRSFEYANPTTTSKLGYFHLDYISQAIPTCICIIARCSQSAL